METIVLVTMLYFFKGEVIVTQNIPITHCEELQSKTTSINRQLGLIGKDLVVCLTGGEKSVVKTLEEEIDEYEQKIRDFDKQSN